MTVCQGVFQATSFSNRCLYSRIVSEPSSFLGMTTGTESPIASRMFGLPVQALRAGSDSALARAVC
jgi:hypothetical protein